MEGTTAEVLIEVTQREKNLIRRVFRSKTFLIGFLIVCLITGASLLAPFLTKFDPIKTSLLEALQPPSRLHWLGTDNFGRDILTRILYGGRTALLIGTGCVIVPLVVGTILGSIAGYFGGRLDDIIMRLVDVTIALPYLVLVIAILAIIGPGLRNVFISVWLVGWTAYARIIRGEILSLKEMEFIEAARALGCSTGYIIRRHIIPNAITPALVFSVTDVVLCILLAS
ncbi:MAG: ABC transporter permease, partial [Deltaproteobacteria bacterium]|nr:ABC transporter permease [Deltaproteobacteria bacterium]